MSIKIAISDAPYSKKMKIKMTIKIAISDALLTPLRLRSGQAALAPRTPHLMIAHPATLSSF